MKLLVCISKTPDTTAKISFINDNTTFNTEGVQYIMNPYDEWYALVKALEIKEKAGGTVTLIHVGPKNNETIIRKGLAIGADDAIRIDKDPVDSLDVATQIANAVQDENYDIIFTGKETIEFNNSEVGSMLSELLQLPFVSYATKMDVQDNLARLTRDAGGHEEQVEVTLPILVSASKGLAEQRIPNMRGIMMAKSKALKVVEPVSVESRSEIIAFETPELRSSCTLVDPENMDELVRLLHEEAKVI
ncbi:MAG: electron transfer flavoprotein subunit beta/FixA family protein [Saprospiraceae bacterium]|nr:electron transfer flavoprotein subunit beta/FixA family protein [Saprospiraceae bacterium]